MEITNENTSSSEGANNRERPREFRRERSSSSDNNRNNPLYNKPLPPKNFKRELTLSEEPIKTINLPELKHGDIRVFICCGVEQIGGNLSAIEYKDEIYIIDCGFGFAPDTMPGIDLYLPNIEYLKQNKHKIKGLLITHGHLDHIAGIPFLIKDLGYPTIYTRNFTKVLIEKRQAEFPGLQPLKYRVIEDNETLPLGENLTLTTFAVTHLIPDSMGLILNTHLGDIVATGDLKLSHLDEVIDERDEASFAKFKDRNVILALTDSTNACQPGFSVSEQHVADNVEQYMKDAKGRLFIGSFSSQVERNIAFMKLVEKHDKKVVVEGRSLKDLIGLAMENGLYTPTRKDLFITAEQSHNYPPTKIVVSATGSQGEEFAAINRMSLGTNRAFTLNKTDTVIFSSSVIPGNEIAVQELKDRLSRLGVTIITYQTSDVHSTGHSNRGELLWIFKKIKPRFHIPVHGYHYMLTAAGDVMRQAGVPEDNIIYADNGSVIDITDNATKITHRKERLPSDYTIIDGNAVGRIQELVLRDRRILAETGIFIVIVIIGRHTKRLKKSPDIVSRGFIYAKEERDLLQRVRITTKINVEQTVKEMNQVNIDTVKRNLAKKLINMLLYETDKRPIVIPIVFVF